jgi:uncharacterized lipoprotein YddW (UPF0748 family)
MPHDCELFKTEDDAQAMREFTGWLRNGGMDALRDMKQCSDEYKAIKQAGFNTMLKAFWLGVLIIVGIASYYLFEKKF